MPYSVRLLTSVPRFCHELCGPLERACALPGGVQEHESPGGNHPGERDDLPRIAFVADPDGYRIELIDGGEFRTPQDPAP